MSFDDICTKKGGEIRGRGCFCVSTKLFVNPYSQACLEKQIKQVPNFPSFGAKGAVSLPDQQRDTPVYEGRDLEGNNPICEQKRQYFPEIGQCDLRSEPRSAFRNIQVELIQREGSRFASDLKTDYFSKIESALVSQYAAVAWLAKESPLSSKDGRFISKAIEEASQKCTGKDRSQIENIKSKIKAVNPLTDLKLDNIPKGHLDRSREFIQKRMLIAWIKVKLIKKLASTIRRSKNTK